MVRAVFAFEATPNIVQCGDWFRRPSQEAGPAKQSRLTYASAASDFAPKAAYHGVAAFKR